MQITCPSCAAEYAVPDEKLAGRAVKCARCGTQWTPVPEPVLVAPPPVIEVPHVEVPPEPTPDPEADLGTDPGTGPYPPLFGTQWPPPDLAKPPPLFSDQPAAYRTQVPQPRSKGLIVAWVLSIVILGAVVIACFVNRTEIMHAWPPSQRAYAVFGLH